jgi:hypothetical protein
MRMKFFAVVLFSAVAATAHADTKVVHKESMDFETCLARIRTVATQLGVAPINIVETSILRVVRFPTNDGSGKSILVTCSKPDRQLLINETSPN